MKTWLRIQTESIDEGALVAARTLSGGMGAVVVFLGYVRGEEGKEKIAGLEYEAFVPMAEHQFGKIFAEAGRRWPLESVRLVHRIGAVPVNEASLWVEVISAHRAEGFEAGKWIIDEMKRVVPIWKKAY